jgi:hypothetical protein
MPEHDSDNGSAEPVEYDLTDWTNEARSLLTRSLDGEEIAHDWVAGTLQVDADHEARVDELIDEVDELVGNDDHGDTATVEVVGGDDVIVDLNGDDDEDDFEIAADVDDDVDDIVAVIEEDDGDLADDDLDDDGLADEDEIELEADLDADQDDEDAADDEEADERVGEGADQVAYDNDDWDSGTHAMLSSLLRSEGIAFVWEAGTLVVNAADEARVDVLVEQVEISTLPPLDPTAPKVVYEIDGWTDEQRGALAEQLLVAGIAHRWDDDENLVILEDDEGAVDPLVDMVDDGALEGDDEDDEDEDGGEVDGLAAQEAMSDLFVAADRLTHDPDDGNAVRTLTAAAERVEGLPVPYGFTPSDWKIIVTRSAALREMVEQEEDDADEDAVVEAATTLRTLLRSYV